MLSPAQNGVTEFDTNQVFETVDINRDGNLTRAEVIKGLRESVDVSSAMCSLLLRMLGAVARTVKTRFQKRRYQPAGGQPVPAVIRTGALC